MHSLSRRGCGGKSFHLTFRQCIFPGPLLNSRVFSNTISNASSSSGGKFEETKTKSKRGAKKAAAFGSQKGVDITKRADNYSAWYSDVIHAADMIDHSPVRGCMIMKPWAMDIWDLIKTEMDRQIKYTGAKSVYFPLLVPLSFLSKEASHVEGFAKECAVVTHHRVRLNDADNRHSGASLIPDETSALSDPLVIRPTSETIIWSTFSRWIQSYKDLPLKVNQWANVMRWEMRPRPFLRTSEFLWQEGHTAHSTSEEAKGVAEEMLRVYHDFCENHLAMPVIPGVKSECEKFAGAESTHTIEGLMQNGWALQCGTSHFLGTNFGTAFDVKYQAASGDQLPVWATSWGVSTRLIGGVIMTHSDDIGLVLPPRIAPVQVVLIPLLTAATSPEDAAVITSTLKAYKQQFHALHIRCAIDDRDSNHVRPGAKYYEWERKGVPVRVVLGAKECRAGTVSVKTRIATSDSVVEGSSSGGSEVITVAQEGVVAHVQAELEKVQAVLLEHAKARLAANTSFHSTYADLVTVVDAVQAGGSSGGSSSSSGNASDSSASVDDGDEEEHITTGLGFYLAPWHPSVNNEKRIKTATKLTIRCYPDDQNFIPGAVWSHYQPVLEQIKRGEAKCFFDEQQTATTLALFARNF